MRHEFPERTKRTLSNRVNGLCSRPECRKSTRGPHSSGDRASNIGVAAHITAASEGGPRFDCALTPQERSAEENGIWLCQDCQKIVDSDPDRYGVEVLRGWRTAAEAEAERNLGLRESARTVRVTGHVPDKIGEIRRILELKREMRDLLIRPGATGEQVCMRPYEALVADDMLIRSIDDTSYPEVDTSPDRISSWFKVETWGFYYNVFEVVLGCHGVLQSKDGRWVVLRDALPEAPQGTQNITAYLLGRIPYRNIAAIDLLGDEYMSRVPTLWCMFADDGTPYEGFRWVNATPGRHLTLDSNMKRAEINELGDV